MERNIDEIVKQVIEEVWAEQKQIVCEPRKSSDRGRTAYLKEAQHYEIKTFDIPSPKEKELLVRTEGCLVTAEDAKNFLKAGSGYSYDSVGGSGTGVIVKKGSGIVKDINGTVLKDGDHVITLRSSYLKRTGYSVNIRSLEKEEARYGWYSSHRILNEEMEILQVNDLDMESRMLLFKAAQAVMSVDRICKLYKLGSDAKIIILGCKEAGLLTTAILKCRGISNIIAVDIDKEKLDVAKQLGAKHTILFHPKTGLIGAADKVRSYFGGEMSDLVIMSEEVTGGIPMVRRFVKQNGYVADLTSNYNFHLTKEVYRQGIEFLYRAKEERIPLYRLVTHRFHLEELDQANWTVLSGKGISSVVQNR